MVDNSGSSKAQMPSMSQEPSVAFPQSAPTGGMKLEAVMEQLQRQQQARLEMERKERKLREAHIMYAQQVAAQQAILAAARASGANFMGKGLAGLAAPLAPPPPPPPPPRVSNQSSVDSEKEDDEDRGRDSADEDDDDDHEMMDGDERSDEDEGGAVGGLEFLRKQTLALQQGAGRVPPPRPYGSFAASAPQRPPSPPVRVKQEPDEGLSPAGAHLATSPNGQADWSFEEHFRQNGNASWADEADSNRGRGEASRDFAKLYELDNDPKRKEFLDDLFTFMQKRGTPVNRIPIMAKQVLDLYMLYKLVTEKGGLVEVINKKIWREITKGLNLPTSITSAAFTLRTQYMKYLYPYECERKGLSSPGELQAAIDSNRREGRRPSYSSSLFRFSPSPSAAPHILSPPKMHLSAIGPGTSAALNGLQGSPGSILKKGGARLAGRMGCDWVFAWGNNAPCCPFERTSTYPGTERKIELLKLPIPKPRFIDDLTPPIMAARPSVALALGQQQVAGLARAATLEQLREKLETTGGLVGEGPERKMARLAEEQQRLMQQAFQHNLLAMASQMPMNLRLGAPAITPRDEKQQDMSLSISTNGSASITVSVEVNGTMYSDAGLQVTSRRQQSSFCCVLHFLFHHC
ncbi:AT-rich interactive domain-containing protein 3B isoform X2 [Stigmatopora argus]